MLTCIIGANRQQALDRLKVGGVVASAQNFAGTPSGRVAFDDVVACDLCVEIVEEPDADALDLQRLCDLPRDEFKKDIAIAVCVCAQDRQHGMKESTLFTETIKRAPCTFARFDFTENAARGVRCAIQESRCDAAFEVHRFARLREESHLQEPDVLAREESTEIVHAMLVTFWMKHVEDIEVSRFFCGVPQSLKPSAIHEANATIRPHALHEIIDAMKEVEQLSRISQISQIYELGKR